MFLQFLIYGLIAGSIYALMAFGFGLIYNTTRIYHFSYGATYSIAAYIFYSFFFVLKMNLLTSLLFTFLSSIIIGLLIEALVYYPLYKKQSSLTVYMLSSLGLYIILTNLIAIFYGNETKTLRSGIGTRYEISSIIFSRVQAIQVLAFVLTMTIVLTFLRKSKIGMFIRAFSDNPSLLTSMGIDIVKLRLLIFGLGSLISGISSVLVALDTGIYPHMGLSVILISTVASIIGGVKTDIGPVLGGFLLGVLQNITIWLIPKNATNWAEVIVFAIFISFLLFRPQGVLSKKTRLEET